MRQTPASKPYVRSMRNWWQRDPFFMVYMARELTAFGVWVYAAILMVGVWRLSQGEAAWRAWLEALKSPWSIALHVVLLVCMVVHAKSWFEIMPKTMPVIFLGEQKLSGKTITRLGWSAALVATVLVIGVFA